MQFTIDEPLRLTFHRRRGVKHRPFKSLHVTQLQYRGASTVDAEHQLINCIDKLTPMQLAALRHVTGGYGAFVQQCAKEARVQVQMQLLNIPTPASYAGSSSSMRSREDAVEHAGTAEPPGAIGERVTRVRQVVVDECVQTEATTRATVDVCTSPLPAACTRPLPLKDEAHAMACKEVATDLMKLITADRELRQMICTKAPDFMTKLWDLRV